MTGSSDSVFRLSYLSASRTRLSAADLETILTTSRHNNHLAGITGLLLYHECCFFQTLEGPRDNVETTYERIAVDPRHEGCLILEHRRVPKRLFAEWSMAFKGLCDLDAAQRRGLIEITGLHIDRQARDNHQDDEKTWILIDSFLSTFRDLQSGFDNS